MKAFASQMIGRVAKLHAQFPQTSANVDVLEPRVRTVARFIVEHDAYTFESFIAHQVSRPAGLIATSDELCSCSRMTRVQSYSCP